MFPTELKFLAVPLLYLLLILAHRIAQFLVKKPTLASFNFCRQTLRPIERFQYPWTIYLIGLRTFWVAREGIILLDREEKKAKKSSTGFGYESSWCLFRFSQMKALESSPWNIRLVKRLLCRNIPIERGLLPHRRSLSTAEVDPPT